MNGRKIVYVAVSGGVDSSVALVLLRDAGYMVTGVYFRSYKPKAGNKNIGAEYCKKQMDDAKMVCKHLGVPFKVFDLRDEYKDMVFSYMIDGYRKGMTPNPDIMCNREIKFGAFAKRAFQDGADYIASGHYASHHKRTSFLNKVYHKLYYLMPSVIQRFLGVKRKSLNHLYIAEDKDKDQTYFLSQVRGDILSRVLFPLGDYKKSEVRKLAHKYGLLTADKKDSQGICFIGENVDVKTFLKLYIKEHDGDVLDTNGNVIGSHQGINVTTIGERHGFSIFSKFQTSDMPRLFIIKRNINNNEITVGTREELDRYFSLRLKESILLNECNWINKIPEDKYVYRCKIRHRGDFYKCIVKNMNDDSLEIIFLDIPYAPASGQFLALYDGDDCIGGGVMDVM